LTIAAACPVARNSVFYPAEEIILNRDRTLLRNFSFGSVELETGKHILTLAYLGASDKIQAPEICLDFIWI